MSAPFPSLQIIPFSQRKALGNTLTPPPPLWMTIHESSGDTNTSALATVNAAESFRAADPP
jgi:hypothetical protein